MTASARTPYARDTIIASAARTTTGNGGLDSNDWSGATRAVAFVIVTATSGTPSMVLDIQDSPDGTNFATVASSAAITTTGTYRISLPGPFADRLRVLWTISGGTPSLTFSVVVYSENADQ